MTGPLFKNFKSHLKTFIASNKWVKVVKRDIKSLAQLRNVILSSEKEVTVAYSCNRRDIKKITHASLEMKKHRQPTTLW